MYEPNIESFDYKPLTLYSFFPENKRLKLLKKDPNSTSKEHKINNINKASKKSAKWSASNYKYNNNNFGKNTKTLKFNGIASSTANNFYSHDGNYLSKKYSINYGNNNKNGFLNFNQTKNKKRGERSKKHERIKSVGETNLNYFNNIDNKEVNEKFIEQFLDNYDSKHQRNIRDMKIHYSNNVYMKNSKFNGKNNLIKSSKNNKMSNEYLNSIRFKNVIRLNNEKMYNYLPYLKSASKDKKLSPKTQKQLLVYGNYNNTINIGDNPISTSMGHKNFQNFQNNIYTLAKDDGDNTNSNKKNNFLHVSSNAVINSFNNNITTNSNVSNTGNNNIIFNNVGSIGSINNNYFYEISRTNTAGVSRGKNYDHNILRKINTNNILYDTVKHENNKINEEEDDTTNENKNNINKGNIIRNFNFLKENKDKIEEKENKNSNKGRASSTAPYKSRNKNSKKTTINIDCNAQNKEKEINNENIQNIKNEDNNKEKIIDNKNDKLSKYELGDLLGKGAYANVRLVTNKLTHEKYAMKIYEKEKLNSNSKKSCVYKEIQILKKLRHKNIVKLIEVISTEKEVLIVQELIEGISLREYYNNEIRNQKGISIHKENIFRIIFKQIFEAMDYLHKLGMAHRDIKLENILIKKNYEIKIIDFGFGMYNPENKLQKFFCGTPNYMPPEIAEKKPYIGQLADMWSLGILVYKIFCADFPFKGKNEKELYKSIKTGKFTMASYTPEYARKIICSLIVLNPNKRMTCEEVLNSDWLRNK